MITFPPTTHVAAKVRDLPGNFPYTRLFGAHLVLDDDAVPLRRALRRQRELERT